jgi:hypothetical protein
MMNIMYALALAAVANFALQGTDPKEGHQVYAVDAAASKADRDAVLKIAQARKK